MGSPSQEPKEGGSNEEPPLTNFIIPDPDDPSDEDYSGKDSSEPSEASDADDDDDQILIQDSDYEDDRPLAKRRRQRLSNTVDYRRFFLPAALRSPMQEADDEIDAEDGFILADSDGEYEAALNASARDPAPEFDDETQVRMDARSHIPVRTPHRPPQRRRSSLTNLRNPSSPDRHHTPTRATMTNAADHQSSKYNVMARASASGGYDGDTITINRRRRPQNHQSPIPWDAIAGPDTSARQDEGLQRKPNRRNIALTPTRRLQTSSSTEDRKPIRAPSGVRIFPRPKKRVFIEICDSDDEGRPRKHVHGLPDAATPSSMSFTQPPRMIKMSEKKANDNCGVANRQRPLTHVNGSLSLSGQHPKSKSTTQTHHRRDTLNDRTSKSNTEIKVKLESPLSFTPTSSTSSLKLGPSNSSSNTNANISAHPEPDISPSTTSRTGTHTLTALKSTTEARTKEIVPKPKQNTDVDNHDDTTEAIYTPTTTASNATNIPQTTLDITTTNLASNPVTPTHPTTTATTTTPPIRIPSPNRILFPDPTEIYALKHTIADLSDTLANLQEDRVRLESEVLGLRRELAKERRRGLGGGSGGG